MKGTSTLLPSGLLWWVLGSIFSFPFSSATLGNGPFAPGTLVEKNFVTGEIVRVEEREDGSYSYVIEWDLPHAPAAKTRSANGGITLSQVEAYETYEDVAAMVEEAADEEDPDIDPISEGTPVIKFIHDERGKLVQLHGTIIHHDSFYYTIHYENGQEELLDRDVDEELIQQMVNDARMINDNVSENGNGNGTPFHTPIDGNNMDAFPAVEPLVTVGDDAMPAPEYELFPVGTHVRTTISDMEWFGVIAKRDATAYTIDFHEDSSRKYGLHDPSVAIMVERAQTFQSYEVGTRVEDRMGRQGKIIQVSPARADLNGVMEYTIVWDSDGAVQTYTTFPLVMEMVETAQLKTLMSSSQQLPSGPVLDNDEVIWPVGTHVRATINGMEWFGVIAKQDASGYIIHFHDSSMETYPLEDPKVDEMVLAAEGFQGYPVGTLVRDSQFKIGEISFVDHPTEYIITWKDSGKVDRYTTFPLVVEMVEDAQKYCAKNDCEEADSSSSTTSTTTTTVTSNTEWSSGWNTPQSSAKEMSERENKELKRPHIGIVVGVLVAIVAVIAVAHHRRRAQQKRIQRGGTTHFSVQGEVI